MPTGPFKSMWEQLAAWGFKPIDENGRTDTVPPKSPEEPATTDRTVSDNQSGGEKV